ncbi:MAG: hypothetical protein AB7L66_09535 [Gemmatimonadales bacterium]
MALPRLAESTLALGRDALTALLGLDRLYRAESGDPDGLAVLDLSEPGEFTPDAFAGYPEAEARFRELARRAAGLPEADRRAYYEDLCRSSIAFATWRDRGLSFERQLTEFLQVPAAPASDAELAAIEAHLEDGLADAGYRGTLREQCAAWEADRRVAPEDVVATASRLMDEAWTRTEERLLPIPADRSDGMRVTGVTGVSYNARCNFLGRSVELNTEPVLTRPGLRHLAVHEGYPGHYVQFTLRTLRYREGLVPPDGLISVVNTASSSVFEGIADHGMAMLGWNETADDRIQALLTRHRAGIGTGAAWRLHALDWDADRTREWLTGVSLSGGAGWVANRMGFISSPARAVLIWSYWWGEPVVAAAWNQVPAARRPDFVEFLYGRMHSNRSVAMFAS